MHVTFFCAYPSLVRDLRKTKGLQRLEMTFESAGAPAALGADAQPSPLARIWLGFDPHAFL